MKMNTINTKVIHNFINISLFLLSHAVVVVHIFDVGVQVKYPPRKGNKEQQGSSKQQHCQHHAQLANRDVQHFHICELRPDDCSSCEVNQKQRR